MPISVWLTLRANEAVRAITVRTRHGRSSAERAKESPMCPRLEVSKEPIRVSPGYSLFRQAT